MVIRVGRQAALERTRLPRHTPAFLGQRQCAAGAGDFRVLGDLLRHLRQRVLRLRLVTHGQQGADQPAPRLGRLRVRVQQRAIRIGRNIRLPGLQCLPRFGQQIGAGHAAAGHLQQRLDKALQLALGQRALEHVGDLPLPERGHRGDRLQGQTQLRQLLHQRPVLIHIDLHQLHAPTGRPYHALQRRGQRLAGSAPRRPEIHQHRHPARRLDHVLHEGLLVAVLNHVRRRRGVADHAGRRMRSRHRLRGGRGRLWAPVLANDVVHRVRFRAATFARASQFTCCDAIRLQARWLHHR